MQEAIESDNSSILYWRCYEYREILLFDNHMLQSIGYRAI